jgi:hypothetical protein
MGIALMRNSGLSAAYQDKAVTILAPASTSVTSAAPRVSQVIRMTAPASVVRHVIVLVLIQR